MNSNPANRISIPQIKAHPFFANIDFNLIYQKKYIPPSINVDFL